MKARLGNWLSSVRASVVSRQRLIASASIALLILIFVLGVPRHLLPDLKLESFVGLYTYSALVQAFAALFTVLGMFFIFKMERLDADIAAGEADLGAYLEGIISAIHGAEPMMLRVPRANSLLFMTWIESILTQKGTELNTPEDILRSIIKAIGPHLATESLNTEKLKVEKFEIHKGVRFPLFLVGATAIVSLLLLPASQSIHSYPSVELSSVIVVSLLATWAFAEVLVFTRRTLGRVGVAQHPVVKALEEIAAKIEDAAKSDDRGT